MDTATLESELLSRLTKARPARPAADAPPSQAATPTPAAPPKQHGAAADEWSSEEDEGKAHGQASPACDAFAAELACLRTWVGRMLNSTPPTSVVALHSGVQLCRALEELSGKRIAALKTEYPPVMAAVHEFKNLECFVSGAKEAFPELKKRSCDVADLYSSKNLPRFVRFVRALAGFSKSTPWPAEVQASAEDFAIARATPASLLREDDDGVQAQQQQQPQQSQSKPAVKLGALDGWLNSQGLLQYAAPLAEAGFTTLQAISCVREEDVPFIAKKGHVRQLLAGARDLAQSLLRHEQPADALIEDVQGARSLYESALKLRRDGDDPSAMAARLALALSYTVCPFGRAIVADMDGEFCWVGLAGDAAPLARLTQTKSATTMLGKILDCGVLPPAEARRRPLFLVGPLTRPLYERCFELWSYVYVCGPLSAAALTLAATGRNDGIAVEEDVQGGLESTAVAGGRAVQGAHVFGPAPAALEACPSSIRQRVRRGGVVLRSARGGLVPIEGTVLLASHERWSMAAKVAYSPEFQHRWMILPPSSFDFDGDLFPLLPAAYRLKLAQDALSVAQSLEAESADKMAQRLETFNAMNLAHAKFFTLEESTDPDAPTGHEQIDAVLSVIRPYLPREAMHDARDFIIANFWKGRFSKSNGASLSLEEIVKELPLDVRRQVVL